MKDTHDRDAAEPPHDLAAEQAALGAALYDREAARLVCGRLSAGDFYADRHRAILEAMAALQRESKPVDTVTVSAALDQRGRLAEVGGPGYLAALMNASPTALNVSSHIDIVVRLAGLRRAINVAGRVVRDAHAQTGDPAALLQAASEDLQPRHALAADALEWDGATLDPPREWLIPDYLPAGRVALFTGAGGAGKSRLALQLAAALAAGAPDHWLPDADALKAGELEDARLTSDPSRAAPVVFASYEDEPDEARRRLRRLAAGSSAPGHAGRGALAYAHHKSRGGRVHYVDLAGEGPLWGPTYAAHVSTRAAALPPWERLTSLAARVGARLLIVDPLAGAFGSSENDRAAVREFVSSVDRWAREHSCAVLLIAHPPKPAAGAPAARYSGSTDWRNAARTVWTLEKCDAKGCACGGGLLLAVDKASYALAPAPAHVSDLWRDAGGAWVRVEPGAPVDGNDAAAHRGGGDALAFTDERALI